MDSIAEIEGGAKKGLKKAKKIDDVVEEESDVDKDTEFEDEDEDVPETIIIEDDVVGSDYEEEEEDYDIPSEAKPEENLNHTDYYRKIKTIAPDDRMTSNIMTLYEFSEIIGIRTLQIEKGSPIFTDVEDLFDAYDMAIKELFDRKCPLMVIRKTGMYEQEEWKANEMGFPADIRSGF